MINRGLLIFTICAFMLISLLFASQARAVRFTSPSYTIDASIGNSFGGLSGSDNYKLVSSGGESIIGEGSGGSYKIGMGFVSQLVTSIQVGVSPTVMTIPTVIAGSPQSQNLNIEIVTDAPSYSLAISQNGNLDNGSGQTIPKITSTIDNPALWSEGQTKGFGFSVTGATSGVPSQWSGPSFAQFPDLSTPTTFYTRAGQPSGTDTVELTYKLDTEISQAAGTYTNTTTITGTITP